MGARNGTTIPTVSSRLLREIAPRFALGAPAARIRALVLRQVGAMALTGVVLGVVRV